MKYKLTATATWWAIIILSGFGASLRGVEPLTAKSFAGPDGKLDRERAAFYIVHRDKEPLSKFMAPGQSALDPKKVVDEMSAKLDDLRSKTRHESPWMWQELDNAYPPKKTSAQAEAAIQTWRQIPGFTKEKPLKKFDSLSKKTNTVGSLGPILLRKNVDELTQDIQKAKGATVAYSKNGLKSGSGALNSEGVLAYPIFWDLHQATNQSGTSIQMKLDLASEWKIAQVQEDRTKDVEELTFSTPLTFFVSPGVWGRNRSLDTNSASSRLVLLQGKPYFQTDFGFRHEIYGIQASAEFVGNLFGSSPDISHVS